MMDTRSKATFCFRLGTLLIAIGLSFGLVSYMSASTVAGYRSDVPQCPFGCYYGIYAQGPPNSYQVITSWSSATPQQMYFLNMTSTPVDAKVYLLTANETDFDLWIASRSGLPLSNVSYYSPLQLSLFTEYIASHGQQVVGEYDVSSAYTVAKYLVPDVEPLLVVLTNDNARTSLNFTYVSSSVSLYIPPALGFWVTCALTGPGIALTAVGFVFRKRESSVD